ncbi:hypothetical protein GN956_G22621 [Arapaima gigas]
MARDILTSLKNLKSYNSEKTADLLKELCTLYFLHEDEKSRQEVGDLLVKEGGAELLVKMFTGFSAAGFFSSNLNVQYLVKASLCILHNAAKVSKNRHLLRQENGVQKIAYYTKVDSELLKVVSIMLLGYIINEDESELIMDESVHPTLT